MTSSEKCSNHQFSEEEITVNKIYSDDTSIAQYKNGYRFNADSMILSWFISENSTKKNCSKGLEIGSGSGIIPIVMNERGHKTIDIDCLEIQESLFKLLTHNIKTNNAENLNPVNKGIKEFAQTCKDRYDIIFSNPPYFPINRGVLAPSAEKAGAKHEVHGNLNDFLQLSYKLLLLKGEFFFVYPVSRIQNALYNAEKWGLCLKKIVFFKEFPGSPVTLFAARLIKGKKGANSVADSDVITMRKEDGSYTETANKILFKKL